MSTTWIDGGINHNINDASNWTGGVLPSSSVDAIWNDATPMVLNAQVNCKSIDMSAYSGAISGSQVLHCYGHCTLGSGQPTPTATGALRFDGSGNFRTNGVAWPLIIIQTGTVSLLDACSCNRFSILGASAALITNGYTLTVVGSSTGNGFIMSNGSIDPGTSNIVLNGTGTLMNITGGAVSSTTHTITVTNTSSTAKTIIGGGLAWGNMVITGTGTGAILITDNIGIKDWTPHAPKTITVTIGKTITLAGTITTDATTSNKITLASSSAGTPFTMTKTSGVISIDWWIIKDCTVDVGGGTGADWYAGVNSTNVSGNSNWHWSAPPVAGNTTGFFMFFKILTPILNLLSI